MLLSFLERDCLAFESRPLVGSAPIGLFELVSESQAHEVGGWSCGVEANDQPISIHCQNIGRAEAFFTLTALTVGSESANANITKVR